MTVFLSWVVFPLVLTLLCGGWGLLCRVEGPLTIPVGFAAVIVVAGLLTAWPAVAPATTTVVALGAAVGLLLNALRRRLPRPDPWAIATAVALLLAFGAPVILSGQATFTGYLRLDDTGTFLGIVDRVLSHGRSLASLPPSTYALNLHAYIVTGGYPIGSLTPLAVGRALVGVDAAWVYQPFLAYCGVIIGLVMYGAARPLPPWKRALIAFFAGQAALLYGYALWGGVKELVAAALVATLAALVPPALAGDGDRDGIRANAGRLALVSAALADTLGPGGAAWVVPALAAPVVCWLWRGRRRHVAFKTVAVDVALLAGGAAVVMVPMWIELSAFVAHNSQLFGNSGAGGTGEGGLVSLYHPLSVFQLGGVWPVGDFRLTASAARVVPFLVAVGAGLVAAGRPAVMRRHPVAIAYPALALAGALIVWLSGSNPWVVGKGLAIASPALPVAALIGAASVGRGRGPSAAGRLARAAPVVLTAAIGAGVIWSNVLGYRDATLAPRPQLAELQHIGPLVTHHGPTFINEYEIYADRHFLRDGAPTEPAEYRPYQLPLADGTLMTQSAQADLDAFSTGLLDGFVSIVTRTSPVESRPPSVYRLVWRGRYYELWQRPVRPAATIVEHVPLGDASVHPYCGDSLSGYAPLCPIQPVATPPCSLISSLARRARADGAQLVAYQRPAPLVARADQSRWPGEWFHNPSNRSLIPTAPGVLTTHIATVGSQRYAVWLGGSFARGFEVTVDGRYLGRVKDQIQNIGQFIEVGTLELSAGVHTIALRYPEADLTPGSGAELTELDSIVLAPLDTPATGTITVSPGRAATLCGRPLDWIELVKPS